MLGLPFLVHWNLRYETITDGCANWPEYLHYFNSNYFFLGHYIVICGYNEETDEFEIRDPASSRYFPYFMFLDLFCVPFFAFQ